MRKLLGLLLAIIGVVFGRAAYENAPTHREDQLAAVTRILTNPSVDRSPLPMSAVRSSASNPEVAHTSSTQPSGPAPSSPPSRALSDPAPEVSIAVAELQQAPAAATPASTWQTSVTAETARPGSTAAVTSASPGDNSARFELVRSIQSELKRLGCYGGISNGSWTTNSKRAMTAFLDRINANLPVEQPDYIQLTLLQNQTGSVCGRDCPKGQSTADDGRCMPNAIVARAAEKKSGPVAKSEPSNNSIDKTNVERKPVDVAAVEQLPWADTIAMEESSHRPSRAGRMSVGGPLPNDLSAPVIDNKLARLEPAAEPSSSLNDQAVVDVDAAAAAANDQGSSNEVRTEPSERAPRQVASIAPDGPKQSPPRAIVQPKVRAVVPRSYTPRPARAVARPAKTRLTSYRPQRSVQNLFTHPLGRL